MVSSWCSLLFTFGVILASFGAPVNGLGCVDEDGSSLDWYILIKHDVDSNSSDPLVNDGKAHAIITSQSSSTGWKLSTKSIDDPTSIIGLTLDGMYQEKNNSDLMYILYNDNFPNGTSTSSKGHTKGVVAFLPSDGFWLVHSLPTFPPALVNGFSYPSSGFTNGQTFLCISLNSDQANAIGQQLQYSEPFIYDRGTPAWAATSAPELVNAANGFHVASAPWNNLVELQTSLGFRVQSFAKYRDFGLDIYADWLAPTFQVDLFAQTWQNSAGALPSACNGTFKVENVDLINVDVFNSRTKSTEDHSVWAVSQDSLKPWVCIADNNRVEAQESRGGGALCLALEKTWSAFHSSVAEWEMC